MAPTWVEAIGLVFQPRYRGDDVTLWHVARANPAVAGTMIKLAPSRSHPRESGDTRRISKDLHLVAVSGGTHHATPRKGTSDHPHP